MNCDPCKTLTCDKPDDFLTYSLQNPGAENPSDDPSGTQPCSPCKSLTCLEIPRDLTLYGLQTNVYFNTEPITITVPCPYGWNCGSTVTVTYPPGTFVYPDPDPNGLYTAQGCKSLVTASTPAQLFQLLALQQAECDTIVNPPGDWQPPSQPPPPPGTRSWVNEPVYLSMPCSTGQTLQFTGTAPYWITVDTDLFTVTGAAGAFTSNSSQSSANVTAQNALQQWVNSALGDGSLQCKDPYENELQTINCPSGHADFYHSYNASIDGDGIYAINGTVYVAAGYWTSTVSQADANAQALAAGQARFNAAVATSQILCCTELSTAGIVVVSEVGPSYSFTKTGSGFQYSMTIAHTGVMGCFGSIYQPSTTSQCTTHYNIPVPDCAKGKYVEITLTVSGVLQGWAAAAPGSPYFRVDDTSPIATVQKSRGAVRSCLPSGTDLSMAGESVGISHAVIPNTPGTKYVALKAEFSYMGVGPLSATVSIRVLP